MTVLGDLGEILGMAGVVHHTCDVSQSRRVAGKISVG